MNNVAIQLENVNSMKLESIEILNCIRFIDEVLESLHVPSTVQTMTSLLNKRSHRNFGHQYSREFYPPDSPP